MTSHSDVECILCAVHPRERVTDIELVDRVLGGDTALYEVILHRYGQRLYRVARAILIDEWETEDAIQQAFVNAYVHLRQFQGRSSFSTWLTSIALNEARARLRPRRSRPTDQLDEEALARVQSTEVGPEEESIATELSRALQTVLDLLPRSYREVLRLRVEEGLSTAQTAKSLGVGDEVVRSRLYRARQKLRERIGSRN